MKLVPDLAAEFENICRDYAGHDQYGKDIVFLVNEFGEKYQDLWQETDDFGRAWAEFLERHKHQMVVAPMTGVVLYLLITYWDMGQTLFNALPTLEKMLVRDTFQEMHDEINRRSAANGNTVEVVLGGQVKGV